MNCPLCNDEKSVEIFYVFQKKEYYLCGVCDLRFLSSKFYLDPTSEKARYLTHENDIHDSRFQKFVSPLLEVMKQTINPTHLGLDFGSGTGPVLTYLLEKEGYQINKYDPYFQNQKEVLSFNYDYIFAIEVIEHFYSPKKEFQFFKSVLRKNGFLFFMTHLYEQNIEFSKWYYKNDPTHVAFYSKKTMQWLCSYLEMDSFFMPHPRVIVFKS